MNKMKKNNLIVLFLAILLILTVFSRANDEITYSEIEKVYLLSLNYDNGKISMNKLLTKTGYAPDRKLQPVEGFKADVVSFEANILYSFKFDVPLKINTDVIEQGEVSGNVIILNETDFALLIPYYEQAKEINIYDKEDKKVFSTKVYQLSTKLLRRWILVIAIGLGGIGIVVYLVLRKKK